MGRERKKEREEEREGERGEREEREREVYSFFIDADWLFRMHVEHLLNALRILESDKSKAPTSLIQ